jgi:D-alanyl-D-alanine carboxypeptidase (penicillin-binding protein 5/6)
MFSIFQLNIGNIFVFALNDISQVVSLPNNVINAKSAILMEASTGEIFYELNKDAKLPIASVTKIMTMLLVMEAIDFGKIKMDDMVKTSENAASMGGSQVYLKPNEVMSVKDLLKGVAVSSGNDCAVALAEHISGSESTFVELMNRRIEEIGAKNTHFTNCNGLSENGDHYSTAHDVALMSKELLKHSEIHDFLTIWTDSLRNGEFSLSNTNRLVRFYEGANGIKTGSTSVAKYCLSASAKRGNMQLISVILGAPTSSERFEGAAKLLDFGFANFSLVDDSVLDNESLPSIKVRKGHEDFVETTLDGKINYIVKKGNNDRIKKDVKVEKFVNAPVNKGDKIGEIIFSLDGKEIGRKNVVCKNSISRITFFETFIKLTVAWMNF